MINHISVEEPTNHPNPDDKVWYFDFVQDIFYVYYEKKVEQNTHKLGIDLGWYPEGDPNGTYALVVIQDSDWEHPIQSFYSRSTTKVVCTLKQWLKQYLNYQF